LSEKEAALVCHALDAAMAGEYNDGDYCWGPKRAALAERLIKRFAECHGYDEETDDPAEGGDDEQAD